MTKTKPWMVEGLEGLDDDNIFPKFDEKIVDEGNEVITTTNEVRDNGSSTRFKRKYTALGRKRTSSIKRGIDEEIVGKGKKDIDVVNDEEVMYD